MCVFPRVFRLQCVEFSLTGQLIGDSGVESVVLPLTLVNMNVCFMIMLLIKRLKKKEAKNTNEAVQP